MKYDVIVCGAGPAGVGAAIGAAQVGKKVLLVDRNSGPGGVAVYCGCPVFHGVAPSDANYPGIVAQFVDAMQGYGTPIGCRLHSSEFEVSLIMNRMLAQAGVVRLFYSTLIAADCHQGKINSITIFGCGQKLQLEAEAFVDATGDAILSDLAGAELLTGSVEETMTKSLLFRVSGVENFDGPALAKKFQELKFPFPEQNNFMASPVCGGRELVLNLTLTSGNALDPFEMTRMDTELREQIPVVLKWCREHLPGFAQCQLSAVAPQVGVRGSRNIVAREMITSQDLDNNTPVAEPVAWGARSYGEHYIHHFFSPWRRANPGQRAIPYGALLPRKISNLAVAGRCIGIEPRASQAVRLMPVCLTTGQVAGIAAATKFPAFAVLQQELNHQRRK